MLKEKLLEDAKACLQPAEPRPQEGDEAFASRMMRAALKEVATVTSYMADETSAIDYLSHLSVARVNILMCAVGAMEDVRAGRRSAREVYEDLGLWDPVPPHLRSGMRLAMQRLARKE